MLPTTDAISDDVVAVLSEESGMPSERITDNMRLMDDLHIGDTIGMGEFLELVDKLEKRIGVKLPASFHPTPTILPAITVKDVKDYYRCCLKI